MPIRGPLGRSMLGLGLGCGGVLVLVGGLALRGPGLAAVFVAGGVSAALAAGVVRETPGSGRRSAVATAVQAAAWTVGALLVIAGLAAVAGGVVATMVTCAAVVAGLVVAVQRSSHRRRGPGAPAPGRTAGGTLPRPPVGASAAPVHPASSPPRLPPVSALPTAALGSEWLRSTAALAQRLGPASRAAIVRRRQETLDELERRDPEGFARWLAAGAAGGSDPARFVRGEARGDVRGDQAAGTDAA